MSDFLEDLRRNKQMMTDFQAEQEQIHRNISESLEANREYQDVQDAAVREGAEAAGHTRELVAQTLVAQRQLVDSQQRLVEAQVAAEKREQEMLTWTRVAGIAAVLALIVSAAAIVVTVAVA